MTEDNSTPAQPAETQPRWQPIGAIDRRVVGALAEKAKTTPAGYPMSLSTIRSACNQKSNRAPVMALEPEDIHEALGQLRDLGAVGMIEGHGRVTKYRHYLYQWLGVDKLELAVMTELLLRGAQTEGELRGRAARMEPIGDLAALRPVLASLKSKGLVISLTPEGRGHVVTHALYEPHELESVKAQYGHVGAAGPPGPPLPGRPARPAAQPAPESSPSQPTRPAAQPEVVAALRREVNELRSQLSQVRTDLEELADQQERTEQEIRELRDKLGP